MLGWIVMHARAHVWEIYISCRLTAELENKLLDIVWRCMAAYRAARHICIHSRSCARWQLNFPPPFPPLVHYGCCAVYSSLIHVAYQMVGEWKDLKKGNDPVSQLLTVLHVFVCAAKLPNSELVSFLGGFPSHFFPKRVFYLLGFSMGEVGSPPKNVFLQPRPHFFCLLQNALPFVLLVLSKPMFDGVHSRPATCHSLSGRHA